MRKLSFTLLSMVFFCSVVFSQIATKDFQDAEVVWYGLDFTQARLVGSAGFTDPETIRNNFFDSWNSVIITEAEKYDLKGTFKKPELKIDVEMIKELNKKVDYNTLVLDKSYTITKEDVEKAVKQYKTEQKTGYGIIFVVESFDKTQEKAFVWATIFDAATKKVVVTERLAETPKGFGLRNFWAGAIYGMLETIKKTKIKSWVN